MAFVLREMLGIEPYPCYPLYHSVGSDLTQLHSIFLIRTFGLQKIFGMQQACNIQVYVRAGALNHSLGILNLEKISHKTH